MQSQLIRKTPKKPTLRDVHVMYWDNVAKRSYWKATLRYNLPIALAKYLTRQVRTDKTWPRGTFGIHLRNGTNPIDYLLKRKQHGRQAKNNLSSR